jgi:signal peptidase I
VAAEARSHTVARFLLIPLTVLLLVVLAVFFVLYDSSEVVGDSMAPNYLPQERLLVTKSYYTPQRGDIVAGDFRREDGTSTSFLKRVVAIPGDEVLFSGDDIWVNGVFAAYPGVVTLGPASDVITVEVPAGEVFLAGDNRPISLDSRFYGTVPMGWIRGKAVAVFAPIDRLRLVPSDDAQATVD